MKKIISFIFFLFSLAITYSQSIDGTWMGKLEIGIELRVVFHFEVYNDTLYTVLDSPDQGVKGIATEYSTFTNNELKVSIPLIKSEYLGVYDPVANKITGTWYQGTGNLPLDLVKVDSVPIVRKKQDPVKPYPYTEEEIVFQNKKADSVFLAGTLTIPKGEGPFNAVVLVTGSGAQDRDEFILGHSPFLVLSDYLTRKGIIVLRYDDRGYKGSTGDFISATSDDFADDAGAAIDYLASRKDLNIKNIGIAGHSEGGLIAPITASKNKDVDFIVLMAGPGIPGDSLLQIQGDLIAKASGYSDSLIFYYGKLRRQLMNIVVEENDLDEMKRKLVAANLNFLRTTPSEIIDQMHFTESDSMASVDFYANEWMKYFLTYDPRPILQKTKIPLLAINGTTDLQVPYEQDLDAIEKAMIKAKNKNYTIVALPGLNHLFQTSDTGNPGNYATNEETFNEKAMETIAGWILGLK